MAWWHRRRDRRIAARGGIAVTEVALGPVDPPPEFTPPEFDDQAVRTRIEAMANGLTPQAVDEATGHSLDNLINAIALQWQADLRTAYETYHHRLMAAGSLAEAARDQYERAHGDDERRVGATETALEAAEARLAGRAGDGTPAWEHEGHSDPTLMAGSPRGHFIHLVALALAACADLGAFFQVVERVLTTSVLTVTLVVLGFTATVLYLAHVAGVLMRDLRAKSRWAPVSGAVLAVGGWLALGLVAFYVRLTLPGSGGGGVVFSSTGQSGGASGSGNDLPKAAVFLALYVATGLVAGIGAYLTHNPHRDAYHRALKAHRAATEQLAASTAQLGAAKAMWSSYQAALAAARRSVVLISREREAQAEELKQNARVLMATGARDPSVTDAILTDDRLPFDWPNMIGGGPLPPYEEEDE